MLGIYPAKHLRVSIALLTIFRALEFSWNMSEDSGMIWGFKNGGKVKRERPWWFGSWMLQPFALGQLLHAVTFDRDCFPKVWQLIRGFFVSPLACDFTLELCRC